jgi:hypothetical protein
MKRVLGLIFVFSLFLLACEKNEGAGVKVEEKIDYTKASIALMEY